MGKCHFNPRMLEKKDKNGYFVNQWAKKHDEENIFCILCSKSFCITSGFDGIERHAESKTHKTRCAEILDPSQLRICTVQSSDDDKSCDMPSSKAQVAQIFSTRDECAIAELRWVMKCVISNWSASSCDNIGELFTCMFGKEAVSDFSISSTKFRYLLTEALGPFFKNNFLTDMAGAFYSLSFDETTNNANAKELQVIVTYWSKSKSLVLHHHLQTFYIGSATAKIILEKLDEAIDNSNLSRLHLLMLGMDGPNVNKKVQRLMSEELKEYRKEPLLDIGSCNIHILHNAFEKGISIFGKDASELVYKVHGFFDGWALRIEDFKTIQADLNLPQHSFIKHVNSRWLTLEGAAERLLEQWEAVKKYFLTFIPQKRDKLMQSKSYKNIIELLKEENMKSQLLFLCLSARVFTRFTGSFQKKEPMIHVLYDELERLAKTLIGKVCKASSVRELGVCEKILTSDHLIPAKDLILNDETSRELSKLNEVTKLHFLINAQKHFVAACEHLIKKSSFSSAVVKACSCLQPEERKKSRSVNKILELARHLPFDVDIDLLQDEWRLIQAEKEVLKDDVRVDLYWSQFFDLKTALGEIKYPTVAKVVKALLCLSHGNAEVERGFSDSARYLTDDKAAMSERTLNAAMTVKSGMKAYFDKPQLVPITKELLSLSRNACSSYKMYLEEERKRKEEEEKRKEEDKTKKAEEEKLKKKLINVRSTIATEENKLQELKKNEKSKRKIEDQLFEEASNKIKKALDNKSFADVEVAKVLLDGVKKIKKEATQQKKEVDSKEKEVSKKKNKLISEFFKK